MSIETKLKELSKALEEADLGTHKSGWQAHAKAPACGGSRFHYFFVHAAIKDSSGELKKFAPPGAAKKVVLHIQVGGLNAGTDRPGRMVFYFACLCITLNNRSL